MNAIRMRGLRAGNLQHLDLEVPHGQWTAVHGPSGAGKSALLFRTLEPVARQRFRVLEDPRALPGGEEDWLPHVADSLEGLQPVLAAAGEIPRGRRKVEVGTALDLWPALQRAFAAGALRRCPECDHRWRPPDAEALLAQAEAAEPGARIHLFVDASAESSSALVRAGWTRVRLGASGLARLEEAPDPLPAGAWLLLDRLKWRPDQQERLREAAREALRRRRAIRLEVAADARDWAPPDRCPRCGAGLPERDVGALAETRTADDFVLADRTWTEWCGAPLSDWRALPDAIGVRAARRLAYLHRTRMGHLSATRTLGTLSLGEGRRLELVALLAQVRRGQLALFDEPGMGLHGSERRALAGLLRELVVQGNTVLTADPAREFLEAADRWLLLGPGGGAEGGRVVGHGARSALPPAEEQAWDPAELAAQRGDAGRESSPARASASLRFRGLSTRFLAIPELTLPTDQVVAIVGVSGSGKSTLLDEELVPRLREGERFEGALPDGGVRVLLERALGSSAFSTVATLSGAWADIRRAFTDGEEARMRGLQPADLVARVGQGACGDCRGHGVDAAGLPCAACAGLGLRDDLLALRLRNRSLRAWLTTPLARLEKRLPRDGRLRGLVRALIRIGLGQRTFGERGRHLSLGERGRIALARALASARRDRPQLFLLDEPCLGLPFREARQVVGLLHELCAEGHGFWVAEHHEVLLRAADHVVELGPGAGPEGGRLLYAGPPDALPEADTPTGRWLASRAEEVPAPEAPPPLVAARSQALPDDFTRVGRARLEADLQRELATRSPLLADHLGGMEEDAGASAAEVVAGGAQDDALDALPPTAWPVAAAADASLLDVLGLDQALARLVRTRGSTACTSCGGRGPWPDLAPALRAAPPDGPFPGECVFTVAPQLPAGAAGEEVRFLLAAGFRRIWREGQRHNLARDARWSAGDEVWLDAFDPGDEARSGRIQDIAHQAEVLGGGVLHAHPVAGGAAWTYRHGACRDCGAPDAGQRHLFAGRSADELRAAPLDESLAHLIAHGGEPHLFERARALLAGTPLLRQPGKLRVSSLSSAQARAARLLGWMIAPLEGVVLLHDQPLSGLPCALARRWGRCLLDGAHGTHVFTDPEGLAADADAPPARLALPSGWQVEPVSLEFDLDAFAAPPRARADATLRSALGLTEPLREHYLRTEEARLRGWSPTDLGHGPAARRCPACAGRRGQRVHPELLLACRRCAGSGQARETAALEDRGLRWPDLGRRTLDELATHFAATPALAEVLQRACRAGLGGLRLDEPLARLPRGLRAWAPILAELAAGGVAAEQRWAAPAAGWNGLELGGILSTIEDFDSPHPTAVWRDNHPALATP